MLTVSKPINAIEFNSNRFHIKIDNKAYIVPQQDIHIMSKQYLLSDDCEKLVKEMTDA